MTATAKRTILYAILALAICGFAYVQGRSDAIDSLTLGRAETLLAGHTGYLRVIDSLKGVEARYVGLEGFWRDKADSLGRRSQGANPVGVQPSSATGLPSSGGLHVSQNDSMRVIFLGRALDSCDLARGAADSALSLCRARGDSLERSLREVLAVKSCRFLFFKCPSRSAFFILGAVGGALLEHRLAK